MKNSASQLTVYGYVWFMRLETIWLVWHVKVLIADCLVQPILFTRPGEGTRALRVLQK